MKTWDERVRAFSDAVEVIATEHEIDITGVIYDRKAGRATVIDFGAKSQNLTMMERMKHIDDAAAMLTSATHPPDIDGATS